MTDPEIKQYLDKNNWELKTQDAIMNILNTSHQIMEELYNPNTHTMTIITPDNTFTFKLNLDAQ